MDDSALKVALHESLQSETREPLKMNSAGRCGSLQWDLTKVLATPKSMNSRSPWACPTKIYQSCESPSENGVHIILQRIGDLWYPSENWWTFIQKMLEIHLQKMGTPMTCPFWAQILTPGRCLADVVPRDRCLGKQQGQRTGILWAFYEDFMVYIYTAYIYYDDILLWYTMTMIFYDLYD